MSINSDNDSTRLQRAAPFFVAAAALVLRLPFLPGYLEGHDAVNFALGLGEFDLTRHRPHFPGYPVYIALAWPFHALGCAAPAALSLPAILTGAAAAGMVYVTLARHGVAVAVFGAGLYVLVPGLWVADVTAMSDGLGVHLATLCACGVLSGARPAVVAFGLGLLLGVRASYLPLVAGALAALLWTGAGARTRAVATFGVGTLAWLVPLAAAAGGPSALLRVGASFAEGHFTRWGGTVVTTGVGGRLTDLARAVFADGLGLAAALAAVLLVSCRAGPRREVAVLLALALPYTVWVLVAQNVERLRHALPLVALGVLAAAPGLARIPRRAAVAFAVLVLVATATVGAMRVVEHAAVLPPALQAVAWVARHHAPDQLQVYTGDEARLFQYYAPAIRARHVAGAEDIAQDLAAQGRPKTVLVTSEAGDLAALEGRLVPVARFTRGAALDRTDSHLTLYALAPEAAP